MAESRADLPFSEKNEAVVIYKKSKFDLYVNEKRNPRLLELLEEGAAAVADLKAAHDVNATAIETVKAALRARRVKFRTRYRARVTPADCEGRLVITVGGDGTLLDASSRIRGPSWTLGVNSDPKRSVGFLCAADAETFPEVLEGLLAGEYGPTAVTRIQLEVDGEATPPILNDALIVHKNPAATTELELQLGERTGRFKSSGVWISGAAGSTAAIHSAGGEIQPLEDGRLQVRVREPFWADRPAPQLLNFFVDQSQELVVESRIRAGAIYLDGPHKRRAFHIGARAVISPRAAPLQLVTTPVMSERRAAMVKDDLRE